MSSDDRDLRAVLFDRDGTLIVDVPYNDDPALVRPMPTASAALRLVRAADLRTGVVSNQSGVARGLLGIDDVHRVNRRVDELLGPFDTWQFCPHGPDDGCRCRKPRPGMVFAAADGIGIAPEHVAVIGDIGADVDAAAAAGARSVLVPTAATLTEEIASAPAVASDLAEAVALMLSSAEVPA